MTTFATSYIPTTTSTVTRQATVATFPATGHLRGNDQAFLFTAIPRSSNQSGVLFNSQVDVNNRITLYIYPEYFELVCIEDGFKVGGAIMMYTHQADKPFQIIFSKSSIDGIHIATRDFSGSWGNWTNGGVSIMTSDWAIGSTYTIGSGLGQGFYGNISEINSMLIPFYITDSFGWSKEAFGVTTDVEYNDPTIMTFTSTAVASVSSTLQTSGTSVDDTVTVVWGDGNSNTYASVTDVAANHTYASSSTIYRVKIQGKDDARLKKYYNGTSSLNISGGLSMPSGMTYFDCRGFNTLSGTLNMPSVMTSFNCAGSNTLSGTLSMPSVMTYFYCWGYNTLSGTLSMPSGMTSFNCGGSNTLSGTLNMPSGLTYFYCHGSNTLSGTLNMPSVMTYFYCWGSNTLSGTLNMPSGLTYFLCGGYNTLSGTLNMPSGLTYFLCGGYNTLSGTLSMPSGMTSFDCGGSNTLSGYTPGTRANNQNRFYLGGFNTMSSSNVDNILIGYAAVSTWIGEKVFYLQGNASNRTSASDAAYATLLTKGLTTLSVD